MHSENENEKLSRRLKEGIAALLAVILLYTFFSVVGIGCPIKFVTGISCFGCGMTRAYLSLLHLDFSKAFYFHPLWIVPPIWMAAFVLRRKFPLAFKIISVVTVILFAVVYFVRLIYGTDDIVVFEPENGLVLRGLKYIVYLM